MSDDWINPTDEETHEVEKKALLAAFNALKGIKYRNSDEIPVDLIFKKSLLALRSVHAIVIDENKKFAQANHEVKCHSYFIDEESIVCSAMGLKIIGNNDSYDDSAAPYSFAGSMIEGVIRAFMACKAFNDLESIIDDWCDYSADVANHVLEYLPEDESAQPA